MSHLLSTFLLFHFEAPVAFQTLSHIAQMDFPEFRTGRHTGRRVPVPDTMKFVSPGLELLSVRNRRNGLRLFPRRHRCLRDAWVRRDQVTVGFSCVNRSCTFWSMIWMMRCTASQTSEKLM